MPVKYDQPFSDDHPIKGGLIIIGEQARRMKEAHEAHKKSQQTNKTTDKEDTDGKKE